VFILQFCFAAAQQNTARDIILRAMKDETKRNIEGLESTLFAYLKENAPINVPIKEGSCLKYLLDMFQWYSREYSGFKKEDHKYIVCNMIYWSETASNKPLENRFRLENTTWAMQLQK